MFRVWENYASDPRDRGRFRVEVLFSPGADSLLHSAGGEGGLSVDTVHLDTAPLVSLTPPDLSCEELEAHLWRMITFAAQSKAGAEGVDPAYLTFCSASICFFQSR